MTPIIPVGGRHICQIVGVPLFPAVIAFAGIAFGYASIAAAEPNSGSWDIEEFDNCLASLDPVNTPNDIWAVLVKGCCIQSGGVWDESSWKCVAPPGESQGSRQLPGNVQVPSDIASAPVVTQAPPRSIQVPSDIATAPIVTQAPQCPPDTDCVPPPVP